MVVTESERRLNEKLAEVQGQMEQLANRGIRAYPAILDGQGEGGLHAVDIKQLARIADIHIPETTGEFKSWIQQVVHSMVVYDTKGEMTRCCNEAVTTRGAKQQALRFRNYGYLDQAMAVLGSKLMNKLNFQHHQVGPLLETYGRDCMRKGERAKAPYILSCVSVYFDTSAGSWLTEKDLYVIRCEGPSLDQLQAFLSQVDYTLSQIKDADLPTEKSQFNWFFGEVQHSPAIKRCVDFINDIESDDDDG